jgi:hypothetical protein
VAPGKVNKEYKLTITENSDRSSESLEVKTFWQNSVKTGFCGHNTLLTYSDNSCLSPYCKTLM